MAISYISGSTENINGGTITNIGKSVNNNKNRVSAASSNNIGSVVIQNNDITTADSGGIFAYNNSSPINKLYTKSVGGLNKSINGNYNTLNNTKIIRSSLISTSIRQGLFNLYSGKFLSSPQNDKYYVCSEGIENCYQTPDIVPTNLSTQSDGENNLTQDGVFLRFRRSDMPDGLFTNWNTIYVPQSSMVEVEIDSIDGLPANNETIPMVNFNQVLPDGEYDIEYDSIVDSGIGILNNSQPTIKRFSGRKKITNSNVKLYKIELSGAPKLLPYDIIDPIQDKNDPLYPLRFKTQETLNNFFDQTVNNTYFISVVENNSLPGNPGQGTVGIPTALQFTAANTGLEYYENFYIDISVSTAYRSAYYLSMNISSQSNRNGTHTAFAGEINIDNPDYSVVGWMAQQFIFAANYYGDGEDGPLKSWTMNTCEVGFCDPPKPRFTPKYYWAHRYTQEKLCQLVCDGEIVHRSITHWDEQKLNKDQINMGDPPVCSLSPSDCNS